MKLSASVIICTYNRCSDLKKVLESLLKQKMAPDMNYEVIVSDNNSSDDTKEQVMSYAHKFGGNLKYVFEKRQGKSYALNSAIAAAEGDIIAFTDDDVMVDAHWLYNIINCFRRFKCDGVGGRVLPVFPVGTEDWIKENAEKLSGSVVIYDRGEKTMPFIGLTWPFIGANFAFKRNVFNEVGGFREDLGNGPGAVGEDTEFVNRVLHKGKSLYYCGEALIWHPFDPKRLTLQHIAKWNLSFGKYATRMEIQKGTAFVYYLGIPRYLWRGVVSDFFKLPLSSLNKPTFLLTWRNFFCKVGMIREYKKHSIKRGEICHA